MNPVFQANDGVGQPFPQQSIDDLLYTPSEKREQRGEYDYMPRPEDDGPVAESYRK